MHVEEQLRELIDNQQWQNERLLHMLGHLRWQNAMLECIDIRLQMLEKHNVNPSEVSALAEKLKTHTQTLADAVAAQVSNPAP